MSANQFVSVAMLLTVAGVTTSAVSAVPIFGGPAYDSVPDTGYTNAGLAFAPGRTAGNGVAVAYASKRNAGATIGQRALRWDASGEPATELGHLGTDLAGATNSGVYAINSAGTSVGDARRYTNNINRGSRAVRWDATGTVATELGNLGTESDGTTQSIAIAINAAGTAVGQANKYSGGLSLGPRAVRWDASGTIATELGHLGTNSAGMTTARARAINDAGTTVGVVEKFSNGSSLGNRVVRWDASGTVATELGLIGTTSNGGGSANAYAMNSVGTVVGHASKIINNRGYGDRAVRWDASGTTATELDCLGTTTAGWTYAVAYAVNDTGTAVGYSLKWSDGSSHGDRAVRWDASGTVATELGNLGDSSNGITDSQAYSINNAGIAVGYVKHPSDLTIAGNRAVYWDLDGNAVDINTLLSPADAAMWTLNYARCISDTNWITGNGMFDPDGPGQLAAYQRAFLIQIPSPSTMGLISIGCVTAARRRRRKFML